MSELRSHKVTMLGTGLIGMFYTMTLITSVAQTVFTLSTPDVKNGQPRSPRSGTSLTQQLIWQKPLTTLRRILLSLGYPTICT